MNEIGSERANKAFKRPKIMHQILDQKYSHLQVKQKIIPFWYGTRAKFICIFDIKYLRKHLHFLSYFWSFYHSLAKFNSLLKKLVQFHFPLIFTKTTTNHRINIDFEVVCILESKISFLKPHKFLFTIFFSS